MYPFDSALLRIPCPRCTYKVNIRFRLAQLGGAVFCPCCKAHIQFSDDKASGHRARRSVRNALTEFEREIKNLNMTITINI